MQYLNLQEMVASHRNLSQLTEFRALTKPELKKIENEKRMQLQCQTNSLFMGDIDEWIERMTDDLCLLVYLNSEEE